MIILRTSTFVAAMTSLEGLVPDIHFLLLFECPDISTLWALSRASPRSYSSFRKHREFILTTIITREVGHEILYEATSALSSSRFESRGPPKAQALDWIAKYRDGTTGISTQSLRSFLESELLPLLRMHRDVKFFAERYIEERFGIMSSIYHYESHRWDVNSVSDTERLRIYRAIYRFTIFGILFYVHPERDTRQTGPQYLNATEQSHSFLTLYPAWQVEELSCISDFIVDQIRIKWQEIEDEYSDMLKETPSEWDIYRHAGEARWEFDFFSSHYKSRHHDWQEYAGSLSLTEIRAMLTARGEEAHRILQGTMSHLYENPLTAALKETPYHSCMFTIEFMAHQQALESGTIICFERDALDLPNEGWLWAHQYRPCELYVDDEWARPEAEGLRRLGHVFWDSERLRESEVLRDE